MIRRSSRHHRSAHTACGWRWAKRKPTASPFRRSALFVCACAWLVGCRGPADLLPARHSLRSEQLLILSDVRIARDDPLLDELRSLRGDLAQTLNLDLPETPIVIYLFGDEARYREFLNKEHPKLPFRRAYFVGTSHQLSVYTFWGSRIREDLRHEFTHGLLHAALKTVPLWLDEGLAEYFEVPGPRPGTINREYVKRLRVAAQNGWQPDLRRMERLSDVAHMQRIDYEEAWAWVHFLLHADRPVWRSALVDLIHELHDTSHPLPLSRRLEQLDPHPEQALLAYLEELAHEQVGDATPTTAQR